MDRVGGGKGVSVRVGVGVGEAEEADGLVEAFGVFVDAANEVEASVGMSVVRMTSVFVAVGKGKADGELLALMIAVDVDSTIASVAEVWGTSDGVWTGAHADSNATVSNSQAMACPE